MDQSVSWKTAARDSIASRPRVYLVARNQGSQGTSIASGRQGDQPRRGQRTGTRRRETGPKQESRRTPASRRYSDFPAICQAASQWRAPRKRPSPGAGFRTAPSGESQDGPGRQYFGSKSGPFRHPMSGRSLVAQRIARASARTFASRSKPNRARGAVKRPERRSN